MTKRIAICKAKYGVFYQAAYMWETRHPKVPVPPFPYLATLPSLQFLPKNWTPNKGSKSVSLRQRFATECFTGSVTRTQLSFLSSSVNPIASVYPTRSMKAPKAHRLSESRAHIMTQAESPQVLCYGCVQYEYIEYMEMDHMQPATKILNRQGMLVKAMQNDSLFADEILKVDGMTDYFFRKPNHTIQPSKLFYIENYNDINNIWLLSRRLNRDKGSKDSLKWLTFFRERYYGNKFFDHITPLDQTGVIIKTNRGQGLAAAAVEWVVTQHAIAVALAKPIMAVELKAFHQSHQVTEYMEEEGVGKGLRKGVGLARKCHLMSAILEEPFLLSPSSKSATPDLMDIDDKENQSEQTAIQAFIKAGKKAYLAQRQKDRNAKREEKGDDIKRDDMEL